MEAGGKWYWWTYLQGGNGDADIEDGLVDTAEEGEGGVNAESGGDPDTPERELVGRCCVPWGAQLAALWPPGGVGGTEAKEGQDQYKEDLPCRSDGEESACNAGDPGSVPGSGRSSGERQGDPLQCSCLEPGGLQCMGSQSQTWLSN